MRPPGEWIYLPAGPRQQEPASDMGIFDSPSLGASGGSRTIGIESLAIRPTVSFLRRVLARFHAGPCLHTSGLSDPENGPRIADSLAERDGFEPQEPLSRRKTLIR